MARKAAVAEPPAAEFAESDFYGTIYSREELNTSLNDLHTILSDRSEGAGTLRVSPGEIEFHFDAVDPAIKFGDKEIPANEGTVEQITTLLNVPGSFMKRMKDNVNPATIDALFAEILSNTVTKDLAIEVNKSESAVLRIDEYSERQRITPLGIVNAVMPVFSDHPAQIARLIDETHEFSFDAYAPFDRDGFGVGGDPKVGDPTAAGFRVSVNLKQGLTPTIQPFSYRLRCTNGMETPMTGLKIEGRGQTVDEVLLELEGMARLAFGQAEKDVEHFYELRDVPVVGNPERAIIALGRERGIPQRSLSAILDLVPAENALPDEPSLFDIVNLVTNFANSPSIRNDGGRLLLERAGGAIIGDHAARCGHCAHRLN